MTYTVLFVDDEQMMLESISRTLHKEPYRVKTANSGDAALKILVETPPSVIVTDMNMPFMDGNEFLGKAQEICPDAVYMILSAYSDIDKIMKAINEQHVWRYINKPCIKKTSNWRYRMPSRYSSTARIRRTCFRGWRNRTGN